MAESTAKQEKIEISLKQGITGLIREIGRSEPSGKARMFKGSVTVQLEGNLEMTLSFNQRFSMVKNVESITGSMNITVGPILRKPKPKPKAKNGDKTIKNPKRKENAVTSTQSAPPVSETSTRVSPPDESPPPEPINMSPVNQSPSPAALPVKDEPGLQVTSTATTITNITDPQSPDLETRPGPSAVKKPKLEFLCKACKPVGKYPNQAALTKHKREMHPSDATAKKKLPCYFCERTFANQGNVRNHIRQCHNNAK